MHKCLGQQHSWVQHYTELLNVVQYNYSAIIIIIIIIIIIKKGWQCKAGRESLTPYLTKPQPHNANQFNEKSEKEKGSKLLGQ